MDTHYKYPEGKEDQLMAFPSDEISQDSTQSQAQAQAQIQSTAAGQQLLNPSQPATPRMLRSVSGTLRSGSSKSEGLMSSGGGGSNGDPAYVTSTSHNQQQAAHTRAASTNQHHYEQSQHQSQQQQQHSRASPNSFSRMSPPDMSLNSKRQELLPPANFAGEQMQQQHLLHQHQQHQHHQRQSSNSGFPPMNSNNTSASANAGTGAGGNAPRSQQQHYHLQLTQTQNPPPQQQHSQQQHGYASQQFYRKSVGDWDFVKTIGAGSMGKVKLAQHRTTREICAVKIVPRAAKAYQRTHAHDPPPTSAEEAAERQKELEKEIARDKRTLREGALGRLLYHPFICRLYEMVPLTNHYYMLFEYVAGGQMLDYIVSHGSLKEKHARKFARGIVSALDYCHKNNVVHRDLKIENIMINQKGDIKIIDFGLSNLYSPKNLLKTYCGSLYFAAPELLSAKPYIGPEVDIWSFGVVLYVLVCGQVPFDDDSVTVLHEKIKKGNVQYPALSKECISLLSRMLVVDPTKRASLYEIMHHPWMNKGYDTPVRNHLPHRQPLTLPLNPEVINAMESFDLGHLQAISNELHSILSSVEYEMSTENWHRVTSQGRDYESASNAHILPDPTAGYHPLISIYYLVDEMMTRKKAKEEAIKSIDAQRKRQQMEQQRQQQQMQQIQQRQPPYDDQIMSAPPQSTSSMPLPAVAPQAPIPAVSVNAHPTHQRLQSVLTASQQQQQPQDSQTHLMPVKNDSVSSTQLSAMYKPVPLLTGSSKSDVPKLPQIITTPQKPPQLPQFPPQAHTSPTYSRNQHEGFPSVDPSQTMSSPQQQPQESLYETLDPNAAKQAAGLNSIFRRLSAKKYKNTSPSKASPHSSEQEVQQQHVPKISITPESNDKLSPASTVSSTKNDPMVRRGMSMKVTAKEKLSNPPATSRLDPASVQKSSRSGHARSSSTSNPNKFHGFIPVEYLPPLPNINSNTNTLVTSSNEKSQFSTSHGSRKLHPTARAKSVGGPVRKDSLGHGNSNSNSNAAGRNNALPNGMAQQNSDEIMVRGSSNENDGFFDDVTLDDMDYQDIPSLTEAEIIAQFEHARPNTMLSIEYPKTLFLKGFFSVQTTSTKPLPVIRYSVIKVLSRLGVKFQEVKGGFVCAHTPSLQIEEVEEKDKLAGHNTSNNMVMMIGNEEVEGGETTDTEEQKLYGNAFRSTNSSLEKELGSHHNKQALEDSSEDTPSRQPSYHGATSTSASASAGTGAGSGVGSTASPTTIRSHRATLSSGGGSSGHRRKFSIGNSFLNTYRKKNGSNSLFPPNTPAAAKVNKLLYADDYEYSNESSRSVEDDSMDSLSGYGGGSDMMVSSRWEQKAKALKGVKKSPLKFEIHIVKFPLVGLYGVQFKKLLGNTWNYKTLASEILGELKL
ncbi:serine/threonine-protein kinase KIN2 [Scheffersomyces spartinae]|uniref:non-specific serine/threonine protein kinase n=1 Tax=Scheffersomyces spartinae TaxID=45513 RepID=A0A9P7V8M5_9ASCO|nr:serine/threonine-protein kinase KIN2 [Scheffersomyces spartinae]KAG7193323.1 serine/threonine-protein kinase KIN2 [Scheffersomyces spartinae]